MGCNASTTVIIMQYSLTTSENEIRFEDDAVNVYYSGATIEVMERFEECRLDVYEVDNDVEMS